MKFSFSLSGQEIEETPAPRPPAVLKEYPKFIDKACFITAEDLYVIGWIFRRM